MFEYILIFFFCFVFVVFQCFWNLMQNSEKHPTAKKICKAQKYTKVQILMTIVTKYSPLESKSTDEEIE